MFESLFDLARSALTSEGYSQDEIDDAFKVLHGDWRLLWNRVKAKRKNEKTKD